MIPKKYDKDKLSIGPNDTLNSALRKMDELDIKLLLVMQDELFKGLLSIGDIQRYFIKHQTFDASVHKALREDIRVASVDDNRKEIKELMLEFRIEYMPVLNEDNTINEIIFWEDLIQNQRRVSGETLNLPVVIMAGGQGTRLKPITNIIPKPLVPIGKRPIIQVIMDNFIEDGCSDFFFSVNYKSDMIKAYFNNLTTHKYNISYHEEEKALGTAGSLSYFQGKIDSTFFVSNCDIIIKEDYSAMYKYHVENKNEMTAVAFIKNMTIPYGTFETNENGCLKSLVEKPEFTFLVNAGLYILEPHLLKEIPENEFFHITHLMEKIIARSGKVGVFPINEGSWLDIGQWKEYQKTLKKYGEEIIT